MRGNGIPIFLLRETMFYGHGGNSVPGRLYNFSQMGTKTGNDREQAVKKSTIGLGVGFPVPDHSKMQKPANPYGSKNSHSRRYTP